MTKINRDFELYIVYINENLCDGCKMCLYMCPCDVFAFTIKAMLLSVSKCLGCRTCEAVCKSKAIIVTEI